MPAHPHAAARAVPSRWQPQTLSNCDSTRVTRQPQTQRIPHNHNSMHRRGRTYKKRGMLVVPLPAHQRQPDPNPLPTRKNRGTPSYLWQRGPHTHSSFQSKTLAGRSPRSTLTWPKGGGGGGRGFLHSEQQNKPYTPWKHHCRSPKPLVDVGGRRAGSFGPGSPARDKKLSKKSGRGAHLCW